MGSASMEEEGFMKLYNGRVRWSVPRLTPLARRSNKNPFGVWREVWLVIPL